MKKCPYCAEEIQDEAIICRFCNRDLTRQVEPALTVEKTIPPAQPPLQPQPKLKSVFWPALAFSAALEACNLFYLTGNLGQIRPAVSKNYGELIFNAVFNICFFGLLYSFVIFLWRKVIKRIPGVKTFSSQSGCVSMAIFGAGIFLFIVVNFILIQIMVM